MKQYCRSETLGIVYCPEDTIQIINPKQIFYYVCHGVEVKDIFPSLYYKTGKKALVFRVDKKESAPVYREWVNTVKLEKTNSINNFEYELSPEEIRILNLNQVIFYLENKAKLLKFYPTLDYVTEEPVLAFVFNKKDTAKIYAEWKDHRTRSK